MDETVLGDDVRMTTVSHSGLNALDLPLLAIPVFATRAADSRAGVKIGDPVLPEGLPQPLADALGAARVDLRPNTGSTLLVHTAGGELPARLLFIGVGKPAAELSSEDARRFAGTAVRKAESIRQSRLGIHVPVLADGIVGEGSEAGAQAVAEGATLAAWRFRELKTGVGESEAPIEVDDIILIGEAIEGGARTGEILGEAENVARLLQSRPGNVATPTHLADVAEDLGGKYGFEVDVMGPSRLEKGNFSAILAVSKGSSEEPRLITMKHMGGADDEAPLVLVGKGLTFDAGGISLKPPAGMEDMRFDMSGGAAVIAAMAAIARLGVKRNVIGIVPSSENLLGASAQKPGDVIRTRSGITVEVINTDAEGRLILCDSLDYALEFEPEAIVDCATLTGAVVIGLGHHAIGLLGTDDDLIQQLKDAGDRSGERCWQFPLWPEYRKQLETDQADLKNVGGRPGGTITAAAFLREFVKDAKWAHLDIAGTAYGDGEHASYLRKGGYGLPTRLLVEWVRSRAEGPTG